MYINTKIQINWGRLFDRGIWSELINKKHTKIILKSTNIKRRSVVVNDIFFTLKRVTLTIKLNIMFQIKDYVIPFRRQRSTNYIFNKILRFGGWQLRQLDSYTDFCFRRLVFSKKIQWYLRKLHYLRSSWIRHLLLLRITGNILYYCIVAIVVFKITYTGLIPVRNMLLSANNGTWNAISY